MKKTKEYMKLIGLVAYPFTKNELKRAYREAAKANHSDKGGDEERMKKVNEANEQLANLALSDVSEHDKNAEHTLQRIEMEEDMFKVYGRCSICNGSGITVSIYHRRMHCENCSGNGFNTKDIPCNRCKGTGKFTLKSGRVVSCLTCKGTGIFKTVQRTCSVCEGFGSVFEPYKSEMHCSLCKGTGKVEVRVYNPVIRKGSILV